jgi:hypothetical protein
MPGRAKGRCGGAEWTRSLLVTWRSPTRCEDHGRRRPLRDVDLVEGVLQVLVPPRSVSEGCHRNYGERTTIRDLQGESGARRIRTADLLGAIQPFAPHLNPQNWRCSAEKWPLSRASGESRIAVDSCRLSRIKALKSTSAHSRGEAVRTKTKIATNLRLSGLIRCGNAARRASGYSAVGFSGGARNGVPRSRAHNPKVAGSNPAKQTLFMPAPQSPHHERVLSGY